MKKYRTMKYINGTEIPTGNIFDICPLKEIAVSNFINRKNVRKRLKNYY